MPVIKTNRTQIVDIFISPLNRQRGLMRLGQGHGALSLGRNGCVFQKVEGDGATPICDLRPIRLYVRPDRHRLRCPRLFPWQMIRKEEGWCDSVSHGSYNRRIKRPFAHSHEEMWRDDRLYDVVIKSAVSASMAVAASQSKPKVKSQRCPKMALPTRTKVAPNWMASAKSALIPIESCLNPCSKASFFNKAK